MVRGNSMVRRQLRGGDHLSWLLVGLLGISGVYTAAVVLKPSDAFSPMIDGVLGLLAMWFPAAVAWLTVFRTQSRRPDILLSAAGISCWAGGTTYYVLHAAVGEAVPLPSPADIGYVGFYLLMLAALAVIVRARLREMTWPVVLDSVIGACGAAAVLGVVLGPLLSATLNGPRSLAAVLGTSYPLMDLLLVATVIGITATTGLSIGEGWPLIVLGLITFTGTDIMYVFSELNGGYETGTPLDAAWAAGIALIAAWTALQGRIPERHNRRRVTLPAQTVPTLATLAGLGVLILASQQRILVLAVVLSSLTLVLAVLPLIFRQRIRLSQANAQARTDELTGLPNRRALYADVAERLAVDLRRRSAVLLLDLDKFKEINDGLGHDLGDKLLTQVAARLSGQLRPSDFLARMGGDEFVIHISHCDQNQAEAVALKLRTALAEPYDLGGITVYVNASIGIACYPEQGQELTLLLRKADMAMYAAKSTHSGHTVYFDCSPSHVPHIYHTVQALNEALLHNQLLLHFQPQIDLVTGGIRGVEALVRWEHPTLGLLQPDAFLKRFDEAGLLPALTSVVLNQALDQAAVWAIQGRPLSVAVNLDATSVMDSQLPAQVATMISARELSPSALVLEITEDVLVGDRNRAATTLATLRGMGVRIAVDDFGKGYSSLSYLRDLPIDELKLDKSFILTMMDDTRATALVISTIHLAHSLGLQMTAEGVEDLGAYRILSDYGCELAQGYLISKPVPAAELDAWLSARGPLPPSENHSVTQGQTKEDDVLAT